MPRTWEPKEERQYEHVKESELKRGHSEKRAKTIAAKTVNKRRRVEGKTASGHAAKTSRRKTA